MDSMAPPSNYGDRSSTDQYLSTDVSPLEQVAPTIFLFSAGTWSETTKQDSPDLID
jgi:hypothetical protein